MTAKTKLLCEAAALVLLIAPAAHAQTAAAPAAPSAAAPPEDTVIVTGGVRRALQSAESVKRNSVQIIDSVVADDIGKLPDLAVSDTAARIAGVQVYRQGGEAQSVLVRGLPYFTTTYNGREIFTAETRLVALQDFPSANIGALQVLKTSTADLVEPGLAGTVNVLSRKPFDFKGLELAGSGWAQFTRNAESWKPNGNFLISDRWNTGAGEMGLLLNASYTELRYLDNEPSNTDFLATPNINGQNVRFPDIQRLFDRSGDRIRPSVNAAFQWRPSPSLEFYAEALWQGFRNRIDDRRLDVPLYGGQTYTNLGFRPGTNLLTSGTVTNPDQIFTFQGATYNATDTFQYAGGLKWNSGRLHLSTDIARTTSTFRGSTESVDRRYTGPHTVDFDLNRPSFTVGGFDRFNPSSYTFQGLYEENQRSAGRGWQGRVDATYDFDEGFFIKNIQVGGRYTDRGATRQYRNRYAFLLPLGINGSTLPVRYNVFNGGFAGIDYPGTQDFVSPTYDGVRDNLAPLRQFIINNCPAILVTDPRNGCTAYVSTAPVVPDLQYKASEETVAGYAQAEYRFGTFVDGAVGVRVVRTRQQLTGANNPIAGFARSNEFTDVLPNASARFKFTRKFQGRLSFTQTRTLANFGDLNPTVSIGAPPSSGSRGTILLPQRGGAGNPLLKPYQSDNYDASLEYYVSPTSFFSVGYFHRDLNGFIQTGDFIIPNDPVYGYTILSVPFNTGKGRIDGVEIQGQSFLDIPSLPKWVRGFGVQGSVTFLNAKTQQFDPTLNGGLGGLKYDRITGFTDGSSDFLFSIVGLYENGPLSARLTWNGRSSFKSVQQYRGGPDATGRFVLDDNYYEFGKPADRIDLSLNYTFNNKATVFFDWTNLTGDPFEQVFSSSRRDSPTTFAPRADTLRYIRYDESVISLGFRFHY